MTMIFCRGCGKQIHDSAPQCPQCGALQTDHSPSSNASWMSIVSIIIGGFGFLGSFDFNPRDKDQVIGIVFLTVISIALAGISLHQGKPGRSLSIVAITLSVLGLLICFGNFH
jgi:uncharacterized membrane protein YvbJ